SFVCTPSTTNCNTAESGLLNAAFDQSFQYDQAGQLTSMSYPACTAGECVGVGPSRSVANTYQTGWLTSVNWNGSPVASTLTYWPNGMLHDVAHGNGVTDSQLFNPANGMPRPYLIQTSPMHIATVCVP